MTASSTTILRSAKRLLFRPRLCLLGPPGSGKGSYGKLLALHWGIPLITASDILKHDATAKRIMASGKLVDDHIVSQALLDHLLLSMTDDDTSSFLLDGFPRTLHQVELMKDTWPHHYHLHAAVHLNVPSHVCERKLLGRRICAVCGHHYNVHAVMTGGFELPPKLPHVGECHYAAHSNSTITHHTLVKCDASASHWRQRDDDTVDIIRHRLQLYQQHTQPILEYYRARPSSDNNPQSATTTSSSSYPSRLFDFIPYKGFDDMPKFQSQLEKWLLEHHPDTVIIQG